MQVLLFVMKRPVQEKCSFPMSEYTLISPLLVISASASPLECQERLLLANDFRG